MRSDNVEETRSILQDTARVFHLNIMVRSLGKDARQDSQLFLSCFHFKLAVSYAFFFFLKHQDVFKNIWLSLHHSFPSSLDSYFFKVPCRWWWYLHFTDEETETLRG